MEPHLISLQDQNIRLLGQNQILVESPGFANIANKDPVFGDEARQLFRLHPRESFNQFWSQLSLDPLTNSNSHFRHQADLAYSHLGSLVAGQNLEHGAILAVPSNYGRDQLAILLGLIKQFPFAPAGLVDLALLYASNQPAEHSIFIDFQLHQTVLSSFKNNSGQLMREKVVQIPGTGLISLQDAWANMIADEFIKQSRFDPQHNAETEQHVFDQLLPWMSESRNNNDVLLEINHKNSLHQARINYALFEQRVGNIFARVKKELDLIASPDVSLLLAASQQNLPGLHAALPGIISLSDELSLSSCHDHLQHIQKSPEQLSLVTSLPIVTKPLASKVKAPEATHLLLNHTAHVLPKGKLNLATGLEQKALGATSHLIEFNNASNLSGSFVINNSESSLVLEDIQNLSLLINNTPAQTSQPLHLGDRIEVTDSDTTLQLIRVS